MVYLYMRVSTGKQDADNQEHALGQRWPRGIVYKETASSIHSRPKLKLLLEKVQGGDTIAVAALDRLGRKLSEIVKLLEDLHRRQINVVSLRENLDYGTPSGRAFAQMIMVMAELERSLISDRTKAALAARKAAGVKLGKPRAAHSDEVHELAYKLMDENLSFREISRRTGIRLSQLHGMAKRRKLAA